MEKSYSPQSLRRSRDNKRKRSRERRRSSSRERRRSNSRERSRKNSRQRRRHSPDDGSSLSTVKKNLEESPQLSATLRQRFEQISEPEIQGPFRNEFINEIMVQSVKPFDERADIRSITCNPNAPYAYGFPRRVQESCIPSLFDRRPLRPENETAESLRELQQTQLVEIQIRRSADYIRQDLNFEAIQCCNHALNLMPDNTDALLGRAIAGHNMDNFQSAVLDLDKIMQIHPQHSRARSIIDKVLIQQAEKLEEARDFEGAKKAYERAAVEFGNEEAKEGLEKLKKSMSNGRPVIDLTEDDDSGSQSRANQQFTQDLDATERRRRLYELEKFKASLAKRIKR